MPTLTRWFIRTSLLFFILALVVGFWMALEHAARGASQDWLFPIYLHLLVFGWLTQLIFGVAYWMFPKLTLNRPHGSPFFGWLLVVSALLQWLAGLAFVVNSWGRVKER
jgi:hypothetical protein